MNAVQISFFTTTDTGCHAGRKTEQHQIPKQTEDFDTRCYEVEPALSIVLFALSEFIII